VSILSKLLKNLILHGFVLLQSWSDKVETFVPFHVSESNRLSKLWTLMARWRRPTRSWSPDGAEWPSTT